MAVPIIYTSALLDTRRRGLGLSVQELAAWCGVGGEKSVRNWINGSNPPREIGAPRRQARRVILARLDDLEHVMLEMVDVVVKQATDQTVEGPVRLTRYRDDPSPEASIPNGAHAVMIQWAIEALEDEGVAVQVEWAD